ncbi:TerD family protein [Streptacidiphilus sp. N1-3]|uniref:TerD family protein n=1 Tax=Streptacidiphilus alkalitolerans TaxID=3342712 RepID=A0ABV6WXC4_9ACTN
MSRDLAKGARVRLSELTGDSELRLGVTLDAPGVAFDFSVFGLDADERLSDDRYFVFFNQPASPENAIELLSPQDGDQASFRLRLDSVPAQVHRMALTATLDGDGTMAQVSSGHVRLLAGGQEVVRYSFTGTEFSTERAVMLADVYRRAGAWSIVAVGQGFDGGLQALLENYGGEVLEEDPAAAPAPAPAAPAPVPAAPTPAAEPASARVSLLKYAELPEQTGWLQQNPQLVRFTLAKNAEVLALQGSMVAYQGEADFSHESSGVLRKLIGNLTGQQLKLMRVRGDGQVFLADGASQLHVVRLEGESLCVGADRILAFDAGLDIEVRRIEGEGLPGGGFHTLQFSGHGTLVVKTSGTPVVLEVTPAPETQVDINALVAWTRGSQVITTAPVRIRRSGVAGRSAETCTLQFRGGPGNFVIVQPYEA